MNPLHEGYRWTNRTEPGADQEAATVRESAFGRTFRLWLANWRGGLRHRQALRPLGPIARLDHPGRVTIADCHDFRRALGRTEDLIARLLTEQREIS
jgi:hypothetical protein